MKKNMVPAGSGEKMQYLVHAFNDNTIRFVLRYPGLLKEEILRRATLALVERVDVLHASFCPGRANTYWTVNEDYAQDAYFRLIEAPGDPVPAALSEALLPIRTDGQTQLCCTLIQGDTHSAVAVRISHLCVDGSDGRYLLGKLTEAYRLMEKEGSCAALAVKNGSRAAEQVYEGLSRAQMRALCRDPRTGVKSVFPYPTQEAGERNAVWRVISAQTMAAARGYARQLCGASANDLILAACYCAYASVPGVDKDAPMSIMCMMDLRRHCRDGESDGLSNLSGSLPTMLKNGVSGTFEDVLREIAAQTAKAKGDPLAGLMGMPLLHGAARRLPMGLLLMAAGRLYGSMAVGLTNLGNIDCGALQMGGMRPEAGWFGGPLKKKPGMQVCAASFDGACTLGIVGQYTDKDAACLDQMLEEMARRIKACAALAR